MLDNPAVVGAATGAAARAAEKRRGRARRRPASGRALRRLGLAALPEVERGCARSPVCGASLSSGTPFPWMRAVCAAAGADCMPCAGVAS